MKGFTKFHKKIIIKITVIFLQSDRQNRTSSLDKNRKSHYFLLILIKPLILLLDQT